MKIPKLMISSQAHEKLRAFVTLVDTEISGMAKSIITPDKDVVITDFIIFDQEVTGATTIISDESQAKFIYELTKANADPSEWNVWWHSHCDMGVFWSGTDDKTIEEHTAQSYLISLVTNKKGDLKARIDVYPKDTSPFGFATFCKFDIADIEVVVDEEQKAIKEQFEKELTVINEKFDKIVEKLEAKYGIGSNQAVIDYCQKEIDAKVKEKEYPIYLPHKYGLPSAKNKKWNWIDGEDDDDYFPPDKYNDDFFNKQIPPIGYAY